MAMAANAYPTYSNTLTGRGSETAKRKVLNMQRIKKSKVTSVKLITQHIASSEK